MQVAETFDMDDSIGKGLSLKGRATLDNCVTVLDAAELVLNLDSIKSLQVRSGQYKIIAKTVQQQVV